MHCTERSIALSTSITITRFVSGKLLIVSYRRPRNSFPNLKREFSLGRMYRITRNLSETNNATHINKFLSGYYTSQLVLHIRSNSSIEVRTGQQEHKQDLEQGHWSEFRRYIVRVQTIYCHVGGNLCQEGVV